MRIKALMELAAWLHYIRETSGVHITINGLTYEYAQNPALDEALMPHLWHMNPYCLHIKRERARWDHCIRAKRVLLSQLSRSEIECIGCQCPFGVYEINRPVRVHGQLIGAVSATYRGEDGEAFERIGRMSERYGMDASAARALYEGAFIPRGNRQAAAECQLPMVAQAIVAMVGEGAVRMVPEVGRNHELVDRATEYIFVHAGEAISVPDICAHLNVSESHLQHLFKRIRGQSMVKTIADVRLQWARQLLLREKLSVVEIAQRCGFDDPNYFSTVFSRRYGAPPSAYRRQNAGR